MSRQAKKTHSLVSTRILVAAAAMSLATAAQPAEVAEMAAEAEKLLQTGEPVEAFETLDAAVDAFWAEAPLTIASASIAKDMPDVRSSAPSASPVFASGETVAIHLQPLGYLFDRDGKDFRIGLTSDVEIRTPGGLILAKSDDIGRLEWVGPAKNRTFSGRISLQLPDLKPGDYQLVLTLTDDASEKSAEVTLPFDIAGE